MFLPHDKVRCGMHLYQETRRIDVMGLNMRIHASYTCDVLKYCGGTVQKATFESRSAIIAQALAMRTDD